MLRKIALLGGLALSLALAAVGINAAPPYTGNTTGTDSAAILNTLTDLYSAVNTPSGTRSVQIATGDLTQKLTANFNRPNDTTPYTANDAVADNTAAGSVTKLQLSLPRSAGRIIRVKIRKSDETVVTPTIRVWFWDATFTVGAGDNAAFAAPLANSVGNVDVAVTTAGSDDGVGWTNCDVPVTGATAYVLLQTLTGYTPAAQETYTVEVWFKPS